MRNISAKDPNLFTVRIRIPLGILYPEQLETLKEVSIRYGDGRLHLTVRKTIEIPGIPLKYLGAVQALLSRAGWYANAFGDNVRNITACPGRYSCPHAQVDTQAIGLELDSALCVYDQLPAKIKIAVAGCPNGCTHPLTNDIGIVGVAPIKFDYKRCVGCSSCIKACREGAIQKGPSGKPVIVDTECIDCGECVLACQFNALTCEENHYRLYVGGKMGRHPQFGDVYGDYNSLLDILELVEKIIVVYCLHAGNNERLGTLIKKISMEKFKKLVNECQPKQQMEMLMTKMFLA